MNLLPLHKQVQALNMLCEGSSIRSTSRVTGIHQDTIARLLLRAGDHCRRLLDERMRNLRVLSLQVDEVWTFVHTKERNLKPADPDEYGDNYIYVAMDSDTKLVPCFAVGQRNDETTSRFIEDLSQRIVERTHISTDGYLGYPEPISRCFHNRVDYARIVKDFAKGDARWQGVQGFPKRHLVCTSHIERQNLTMRMQIRRLTRRVNAFSKKRANLEAALAMYYAWYNFVRIHGSLGVTPAMEAGLTSRLWRFEELIPRN